MECTQENQKFVLHWNFGYYEDDDTYHGSFPEQMSFEGESIEDALVCAGNNTRRLMDELSDKLSEPNAMFTGTAVAKITDSTGNILYQQGWQKFEVNGATEYHPPNGQQFNVLFKFGYHDDEDEGYYPLECKQQIVADDLDQLLLKAKKVTNDILEDCHDYASVAEITDNQGNKVYHQSWKRYEAQGIEEVYDAYDDFEHNNPVKQFTFYAPSDAEAVKRASTILQNQINKERKAGGYMSRGTFLGKVTEISDPNNRIIHNADPRS